MAVDVKEGVSSTATAKGGFSVKPSDGAPGYFDVLEEYSSLELAQGGGAKVGGTGTLDSNRWRYALLRANSNPSPSPNPNPNPDPSPNPSPNPINPDPNPRWSCVFLSPELRICRLPDGSRRTYAKVLASP